MPVEIKVGPPTTLFRRDSLMVSYQTMAVAAGFARGALKRLAEHQATERDDWREAQPGKIMHEIRFGELAHFHKVPFTPFYGTADATILYLIVLSETYRWTGGFGSSSGRQNSGHARARTLTL